MKWRKLGRIFNPTEHKLFNNCIDFAQSPQTLVFDDFVRIYFSTREKDNKNGKYLSHIAYVDFDKDFKNILKISDKNVIELGELGTFDEHGIFPINVFRDNDKIYAYTCGWSRRVSVSVETSIGAAISEDNGDTFKKIGAGPILTSSLNEPFLVGDGFVAKYNGVYHMWYIFGERWIKNDQEGPARVYKIGHATSDNSTTWKKQDGIQIISDKLNSNECQALPSVIKHNGIYHMVFCYREAFGFRNTPGKGYKLGYASSKDLLNWNRNDDYIGFDLIEGEWDADMQCYPHIFHCNEKVYLLYNGNQFGRYGFGLAVLSE